MLSPSCLGLVILLIFRGTSGDSVYQTEGPVTLPEGAYLTLNCTYQTTYSPVVFWYVQYKNKEPVFLLKTSSEEEVKNKGFQAHLLKTDSSFHLTKSSVQMSDAAVYYCALSHTVREAAGAAGRKPRGSPGAEEQQPGSSRSHSEPQWLLSGDMQGAGHHAALYLCRYLLSTEYRIKIWTCDTIQDISFKKRAASMLIVNMLKAIIASICLGSSMTQKVIQAQSAISVVEKEAVTLNCAYEVSSYSYYLLWYKQPPSGKMTFIIQQESYNEQATTEGRYSLNFQKSASSINLTIRDSQLWDSAVYFCALRGHSDVGACGNPTKSST